MADNDTNRGWNRRFARRSMLRGAAFAGAGLAGAALLGCGGSKAPESAGNRAAVTGATPSGVDPALGAAGGAGKKIAKGRPGGTLRMGWYIDDVAAMSHMANGGAVTPQSHVSAHSDSVVYGSADGKISPMLWTQWESSDGQHIVAKLRPNLKFQDEWNSPLDAAAVKWSFETLRDPKLAPRFTTYRGLYGSMFAPGGVEVVDPLTMKINLRQVDAGFISNLVAGLPNGQILSQKHVETYKDKEFSNPRFHGPYTVENAKPAVGFTSKKFAGYWGGNEGYESYLDAIEWKIIIQSETRAAALRAKELDAAFWREADSVVGDTMKEKGMQTVLYDSSPHALNLNHVAPPFTDLRVRQALAYSIDRAKVREVAYGGFGEEMKALVLPFSFGYKDSDPYQYNPAEAKKLLAAANIKPKVTYAIVGAPPPALANKWAALYGEMMKATGFEVEVKNTPNIDDLPRETPWVSGTTIGQRFDAYGSWTLRATYEGEIGQKTRANQPGDPPELRKIQDDIDALVRKGRGTLDTKQRESIAFEIADMYHKNVMGNIPVTRTRGTLMARENVGGMDHPDMGFPLGSGRPRFLWMKA
ncbi:MAG: ABC transporter substrate-binding protein [Chloroflexota bacterium]